VRKFASCFTASHRNANGRRVGVVRRERANGYGIHIGVPIGLDDYDGARLTGVVWAAYHGPDFSPFHRGLSLLGRSVVAIFREEREDGDGIDKILVFLLAGTSRDSQGVAAGLTNEGRRIHVRKPDLVKAHSLPRRRAARGRRRLRGVGAGHGFSLRHGERSGNCNQGSFTAASWSTE
jgi:hypothetical protein